MLECLALARKGAGRVSPNPMVGCIIVKEGRVVGRGYHKRFGGPHAEVEAIRSARRSVRGATLYVNVEPCNVQGKTPPCTDLIIRSKIACVVAGIRDPNPNVSGKGFLQLRRAGVKVRTGVLADECRRFNEFFCTYITTGLPFVTLKVAQSLDGIIAHPGGRSRWITGFAARRFVHEQRSRYDAVLVGAGTVRADNPRLTVRHVRGRNPIRVILDGNFRLSEHARLFNTNRDGMVILMASKKSLKRQPAKRRRFQDKGIVLLGLDKANKGYLQLKEVLRALGRLGIASILVEGGACLSGAFLRERACDKLLLITAPAILGNGVRGFKDLPAPVRLRPHAVTMVGEDTLFEGYLT